MSTPVIIGSVVAYVLAALSVAWVFLPAIYREFHSDVSEEWESRWVALGIALVIGALWPLIGLATAIDRLVRQRIGR